MRKYLVLPKGHRLYRGRYCLDGETKLHDVPLRTSDKQVAEQRLNEIVRETERERAGIIPPRPLREAAKRCLSEHLKEYAADLEARGRDEHYVYHVEKRLVKLLEECGWEYAKDVTADSFQGWRARQEKAAKTLNEYLEAACGFLMWMEKNGRILANPLKNVGKVETRGMEVRVRRAFTDQEVSRLLGIAGDRKAVYLTALLTGLRRAELESLQWGDVMLEAGRSFVKARASTTKNHKVALIPLRKELATELRKIRPENASEAAPVFNGLMPSMLRFRTDLKKANIPYLDAQGRRADFHALRHTLATNLSRLGVPLSVAMEVMRHSDPKLTLKTYTDASQLPTQSAIALLPIYGLAQEGVQAHAAAVSGSLLGSPKAGILRHAESLAGKVPETHKTEKGVIFRGEIHSRASPVTPGHKKKMAPRVGFEPTTNRLTADRSTTELPWSGSAIMPQV